MKSTSKTIQAIWVAAGSFFNILTGIVITMVLARKLSTPDLGTFRQVFYVYTTLSILFAAGLPSVYSYFLPKNSIETGYSIVKKITVALGITGISLSIILYTFASTIAKLLSNDQLESAIQYFAPTAGFLIPTLGIEGILASNNKFKHLTTFNIITKSLQFILVISFVFTYSGNHIDALRGYFLASIINFFIALYFQKIPYSKTNNKNASISYRSIFNYSLPVLLASIWGVINKAADHFYVSRYLGTNEYATYSLAMIELPLTGLVTASVSTVLFPYFSGLNNSNDKKLEMLTVWSAALKKSAMIIYPTVVFSIFFSSDILTLLYSEKYQNGAIYFSIGQSINFFNIIVFGPLLLSIGKTKLYSLINMAWCILTWLLIQLSVLIHPSGWIIASIKTTVSIAVIIFCIIYIKNYFAIRINIFLPYRDIAKLFIASIFSAMVTKLISLYLINQNIAVEILITLIFHIIIIAALNKYFQLGYSAFFKSRS